MQFTRYIPSELDEFFLENRRPQSMPIYNSDRNARVQEYMFTEKFASTEVKMSEFARYEQDNVKKNELSEFIAKWNTYYTVMEIKSVLERVNFNFQNADDILSSRY